MISTLAAFAAPLTEADFLALLRRRELKVWRGAMTPAQAALLDWSALRGLIDEGNLADHDLRVSQETRSVQPALYQTGGKADPAKLDDLLARGASIVVSGLETRLRVLRALQGDVQARLREKITAHAVVSTGAGGAFLQHYDCPDIVVLQLEGAKRWQVHAPTITHPVEGMEIAPRPAGPPILDTVLEQGDILFLPGGCWHSCENRAGRSLHLSIAFAPLNGWNAVAPLLRQLQYDEDFRAPLTRCEAEADRDALEARLKARLVQKIGELSLRDLLSGRAQR